MHHCCYPLELYLSLKLSTTITHHWCYPLELIFTRVTHQNSPTGICNSLKLPITVVTNIKSTTCWQNQRIDFMDLDPAAHGLVSFNILGLNCTVTSGTLPIICVHSLQYCCVQIKGVTTKILFLIKSYCSNMDISLIIYFSTV